MSRDITPFGLRMPTDLKSQIDAAADAGGRSINAEIVDRLRRSFKTDGLAALSDVADGALLDEVITRYGARLQLIITPDVAAKAGIASGKK